MFFEGLLIMTQYFTKYLPFAITINLIQQQPLKWTEPFFLRSMVKLQQTEDSWPVASCGRAGSTECITKNVQVQNCSAD